MPGQTDSSQAVRYLNLPQADRKVFRNNYLDQVIIELRFPTLLRLKEKEPLEIQEAIREKFPQYQHSQRMQMTPLGTTAPEPVYQFSDRHGDPTVELSTSNIVLIAKRYQSFETFIDKLTFLIEHCLPHLKTTFFTRIGLRYINHIAGIPDHFDGYRQWINPRLLGAIDGPELGTVGNLRSEINGFLENGSTYTFNYGLSPPQPHRHFVLDYDYGKADVDARDALGTLQAFHAHHFDFFWWSIGQAAREALENGSAQRV